MIIRICMVEIIIIIINAYDNANGDAHDDNVDFN